MKIIQAVKCPQCDCLIPLDEIFKSLPDRKLKRKRGRPKKVKPHEKHFKSI